MTILVNELRGFFLRAVIVFVLSSFSVYPRVWVSLFIFLVSVVPCKIFIPYLLPRFGSPPPFFNAARNSLVTHLPDIVAKLPISQDKLAAVTELDAVIACTDAIADEKQVLLAKIVDLESANVTLSNKLQMNEMATAWLEEQIAMKTESQNEILEDMGKLEGELEAVKGELDAAKATIIELETRLRDSSMNVVSLEHQIALKTEAQNEILEGMDHLEDELKTAKVKIQETSAQKAAIERDLVQLRVIRPDHKLAISKRLGGLKTNSKLGSYPSY
ncbi:hypothetical protein GSI_02754 [Ganoderma sinense ZZ0214-1]|uniref:Uncharacterized protein n=1 Tax=Ganoderma sinense ZZ0214-1 TaxID=1077348 RepID=A0A2G8SMH0_9APHY|nr:hypothetical protein GSI_02754 [Ganoderma sinense ZZ0214-1]